MNTPHRLEITLTLLGPILTRGGHPPDPGIDAPLARDGQGCPMLPFSLVKGKVRDALRDSAESAGGRPPDDWLGAATADGGFDPSRGRLRFTDFVTETVGCTEDGVIERIEVADDTGTAEGRMLAMLEAPFGYGQPVVFTGAVDFVADDGESKEVASALDRALRKVPAFGALRSVGFGRTHDVATKLTAVPKSAAGSPNTEAARLPVRLALDRPLCVVGRKHAGNHFESLEAIPGAVLKGAVARLVLELAGERKELYVRPDTRTPFRQLATHFAEVRFSEALPQSANAATRPVVPPLSMAVSDGTTEPFDVALWDGPGLVRDEKSLCHPPRFAPDWKDADYAAVRKQFGWPEVPRERRTRTAIDEATGRAKDEQLFSYGLILPDSRKPSGEPCRLVWDAVIGLEKVPADARAGVAAELAELLAHGLPNIGKTRATATIHWLESRPAPAVSGGKPAPGFHVVTLQTDCLMTDPAAFSAGRPPAEALHAAYADFWLQASAGAVTLERFFARQTLHGGYLGRRFGRGSHYEPFLVTEAGSVFVLKVVNDDAATDSAAAWQTGGLLVPAWAGDRYRVAGRELWQTCPFLPHAGFGEVAVDLACHTSDQPPRG